MSYTLYIEGEDATRRVRRGILPRPGEWLNLKIADAWHWVPVLEVTHALSPEKEPEEPEAGSDFVHEEAEGVVVSSLALAVRVDVHADDTYKLVLPPPRWPFGGRGGEEDLWNLERNDNGNRREDRGPRKKEGAEP